MKAPYTPPANKPATLYFVVRNPNPEKFVMPKASVKTVKLSMAKIITNQDVIGSVYFSFQKFIKQMLIWQMQLTP